MKIRRMIMVFLAALMICLTAVTAMAGDSYYEEQVRRYNERKTATITTNINCTGWFALKSTKLYGREITGVRETGEFILGPWKMLDYDTNMTAGTRKVAFPGTYAQFAYSCDILWGTDFPFSGIYWTDVNVPVTDMFIDVGGICRCVNVEIYVNGKCVRSEYDCDSHSEWTP